VKNRNKGTGGTRAEVAASAEVFGPDGERHREFQTVVRRQLELLGEDPERPGLARTPVRVANALTWLTRGYRMRVEDVVGDALFEETHQNMVMVRDIELYSLCEHHLLPFFGKCHVAYIPRTQVIGLSKIPRLVDVFARRLQIQERMTAQIADTIREKVDPLGVAVVCEGTHLCMAMRGVEKQNSFAVTSAMLGVFRDNARTRMEFLELIRQRGVAYAGVPASPGLACIDD
jgi:GTP cyclohydrolase IA